jgi:hypothetical protein
VTLVSAAISDDVPALLLLRSRMDSSFFAGDSVQRRSLVATNFLMLLAIGLPLSSLGAQAAERCRSSAANSTSDLRSCLDTLFALHSRDSADAVRARVTIDSLTSSNRQILLAIQDINRRLPPRGDSSGATVINGDLILNGRLCIPDACIGDAAEQIQIRALKSAGILFQSNRDGTWTQSPCAGISNITMSPDLGLRLVQNQRWTPSGTHVNFICPNNATGSVGFDSQAEWSFNGQKPGRPEIGTQRLVIRTDEDAKTVYFATWAEGWKIEFRSSADGCKWCENLRWKVPYQ